MNASHARAICAASLALASQAGLQAAEPPRSDDAAYDVIVYGDSSGAAIAARREGRSVI